MKKILPLLQAFFKLRTEDPKPGTKPYLEAQLAAEQDKNARFVDVDRAVENDDRVILDSCQLTMR